MIQQETGKLSFWGALVPSELMLDRILDKSEMFVLEDDSKILGFTGVSYDNME